LVVTHLPQVAAFADRHLVVQKDTGGAITTSGVKIVEETDRARELARMLAGLPDSDLGIAHAEELLALRRTPADELGDLPFVGERACRVPEVTACQDGADATSHLRRTRTVEPGAVTGTARLDAGPSAGRRLRPGDIAVIDHVDIDRVAADSLVAGRVPPCSTQAVDLRRYPNSARGADQAGIVLIDDLGEEVFERITRVTRQHRGRHRAAADGEPSRAGSGRTPDRRRAMADAREGLSVQLEAFAANTMDYLKQERDLLLDGVGVPDVQTQISGGTCSSWCAATTTRPTWTCCGRTSASSSRC
jgi:hypothetical protein